MVLDFLEVQEYKSKLAKHSEDETDKCGSVLKKGVLFNFVPMFDGLATSSPCFLLPMTLTLWKESPGSVFFWHH